MAKARPKKEGISHVNGPKANGVGKTREYPYLGSEGGTMKERRGVTPGGRKYAAVVTPRGKETLVEGGFVKRNGEKKRTMNQPKPGVAKVTSTRDFEYPIKKGPTKPKKAKK